MIRLKSSSTVALQSPDRRSKINQIFFPCKPPLIRKFPNESPRFQLAAAMIVLLEWMSAIMQRRSHAVSHNIKGLLGVEFIE